MDSKVANRVNADSIRTANNRIVLNQQVSDLSIVYGNRSSTVGVKLVVGDDRSVSLTR